MQWEASVNLDWPDRGNLKTLGIFDTEDEAWYSVENWLTRTHGKGQWKRINEMQYGEKSKPGSYVMALVEKMPNELEALTAEIEETEWRLADMKHKYRNLTGKNYEDK